MKYIFEYEFCFLFTPFKLNCDILANIHHIVSKNELGASYSKPIKSNQILIYLV